MNKILYIGPYSEGTTSRMRAEDIKSIYGESNVDIIDTHVPFYQINKIYRSIGFRFKKGPLIQQINKYIRKNLVKEYDIIWVEKAIFISKETTKILKDNSRVLIHYTPDMAFYENKSNHFYNSIRLYNYLVTTKTKEKELYANYVDSNKIILTTQGYSKTIHKKYYDFHKKKNDVIFIGLAEPHRLEVVERIINNGINIKVGGIGWEKLRSKYSGFNNFNFIGKTVLAEDYGKYISSSKIGLGFLSKRFQELHTTRTFEIPACGTALATERNSEISNYFDEEDVIYYDSIDKLILKIQELLSDEDQLKNITNSGLKKVNSLSVDHYSIVRSIFNQIEELNM